MSIIQHMTKFTEKLPPEGVDLFVVCNPDSEDRDYDILRFYKKGTQIEDDYRSPIPCGMEKLLDEIMHHGSLHHPAEKTAYYMFKYKENCPVVWWPSSYDVLDSVWAVINPEKEKKDD